VEMWSPLPALRLWKGAARHGTAPGWRLQRRPPLMESPSLRQTSLGRPTLNFVNVVQNTAFFQQRSCSAALPSGSIGTSFSPPGCGEMRERRKDKPPTTLSAPIPCRPPKEVLGKPFSPRDTAATASQDLIHEHSLQRCRSAAAVLLL